MFISAIKPQVTTQNYNNRQTTFQGNAPQKVIARAIEQDQQSLVKKGIDIFLEIMSAFEKKENCKPIVYDSRITSDPIINALKEKLFPIIPKLELPEEAKKIATIQDSSINASKVDERVTFERYKFGGKRFQQLMVNPQENSVSLLDSKISDSRKEQFKKQVIEFDRAEIKRYF